MILQYLYSYEDYETALCGSNPNIGLFGGKVGFQKDLPITFCDKDIEKEVLKFNETRFNRSFFFEYQALDLDRTIYVYPKKINDKEFLVDVFQIGY